MTNVRFMNTGKETTSDSFHVRTVQTVLCVSLHGTRNEWPYHHSVASNSSYSCRERCRRRHARLRHTHRVAHINRMNLRRESNKYKESESVVGIIILFRPVVASTSLLFLLRGVLIFIFVAFFALRERVFRIQFR